VNIHGWIAKRLFEFDIAQFFYLYQLLLNAIGITLHVGILWTHDRDFRGRRRAEVQGLTDEIARIKRKMRTWKFLRQFLSKVLFETAQRNLRSGIKANVHDCLLG